MARPLSILNPEPQRLPGPSLLHDLVAHRANDNAIAIDFEAANGDRERLSYADLHARSDALASRLAAHRATSRPCAHFIVPLYIPQCLDLYVSQLAVLKAGGAFCPVPLDAPEERLRFILEDVEASILLTTSSVNDQLPWLSDLVTIIVGNDVLDNRSHSINAFIDPSRAAYIMYTSGSTGTPKGVVISHSAATQALHAHKRHIPAFKRFLQFANPTFDVSVFEIFFPLLRGATLVACDRRQLLNDLPGVINRLAIDAAELTPSVANSLLHDRKSVPGLELLLTIGEMLQKSVTEAFGGDATEPSMLYGMYGPTEATIHCTLQSAFGKTMSVGNIGVPLDTVSAFIVRPVNGSSSDDAPEVVEVGEEGELAIGGYQLADGYLNRDEQTKAAFVRHPQYGQLYRTGDRARMTAEAKLECLGRISSGQIKLRGQRIELGEIEYAASRTPGCRSSIVEVVGGTLVAFCVCPERSTTVKDVHQTCRKWLPTFMVPTDIVLLDTLPYLPSGKVDRRALIKLNTERQQTGLIADRFSSSNAARIAKAISTVLHIDVVATTNLAYAGVDSLSAIRIASELRRAGFPQIDANAVLEAHDVQELEDSVACVKALGYEDQVVWSELRDAVAGHPMVALLRDDICDVFPCTSVQSAMLLGTAQNHQAYCNTLRLEIDGGAGITQLQAALRELALQHPLLRSGFLATDASPTNYAVIVWKAILPAQVEAVEKADEGFIMAGDADALRPCRFQLETGAVKPRAVLHIHHALYDQWSIDVLKADLSSLLQGNRLAETRSFQSISAYHSAGLAESDKEQHALFWQNQLQGMTLTPLPNLTGCAGPPALHKLHFRSTNVDMVGARAKTKELGCSMTALYQAAFAYLFGFICGSTDVIFGTVVSGRTLPVQGIERIFGPCFATLPCRIDVASARTCGDLLRLLHDTNRDLQRHATTSLADIKTASSCAPNQALFDTLFVWQETSLALDGATSQVRETESIDRHEFNLVLEFEPSGNSLAMQATFQSSLVPPPQMRVMLEQLDCIATCMLRHPAALLASVSSSLDTELLSVVNPRPSRCAESLDIVSAIECQAKQIPDSPALLFATSIDDGVASTDMLTYSDLNSRSNKLARHLRSLGVSQGDLVCICMEKSIQLYVSILAILKAGAGYLPLVPDTPRARLRNVLRQAKIDMCLCDTATAPLVQAMANVVSIDTSHLVLNPYVAEDLQLSRKGTNIAYAVFTSGSTGEPKGVAVTHDNLSGNLEALSELYSFLPGDRLLQACSHAFDVSVFEILFAVTRGLTLCSATKSTLFRDLEESIRTLGVTHLSLTPTVAALIDPDKVPSVRFLVTAGEAVTDLVHKKWAGRGLNQGYGPSETTNICSVNMNVLPNHIIGNVGPPLRNTSAFVIAANEPFKLLPAGALGELAFGGEQVFHGYLGRADLNSSKLMDHPEYGRLYKSGDIGRILHDGSLLIVGRIDDQVKIRGNRVELGEINSLILEHDCVVDCATTLCGADGPDQELVAFWVPTSQRSHANVDPSICESDDGTVSQLFAHLENKLPTYMIPNSLVPITGLPLTSQTKLDRRFLLGLLSNLDDIRKLRFSRCAEDISDDRDWSSGEQIVADVLAGTLQISRRSIGRNTSFFALGLHSLRVFAFVRALSRHFTGRIGIDTVLRHSTVARLTAALTQEAKSTPDDTESDVAEVFSEHFVASVKKQCQARGLTVERVLPCTPLQEAMLSSCMSQESLTYCNTTTFRLVCDLELLRQCWTELVERHAILRTHFVQTISARHPFAQVITKHLTLPWHTTTHEVTERCARKTFHDAESLTRISMSQPFNIEVIDSSEGLLLVLRMHHAISDGAATAVLLDEVEQLYRGETLPPTVAFGPFLAGAIAQSNPEATAFWSKRFNDYAPRPFPASLCAAPGHGSTPRQHLSTSVYDVEVFCRRHSVTPLSVLQAAWAKVLTTCQQADDVSFGTVVSGRTVAVREVERLVAPCFNTIPIRANLARCRRNIHLIQEMHSQNISNVRFQLFPLRRIQALSQRPDLHLFDSLVLLQPPERELDQCVWRRVGDEGVMDMPVVLEITQLPDGYHLVINFSRSCIKDELAGSMVKAFASAMLSCLAFPSADVAHLGCSDVSRIAGTLRSWLHSDDQAQANGDADTNDDWTSLELLVREVFAALSGARADNITRYTSMYRLGLDSLNAAQVAARLRLHGHQVGAADIIENLTPVAIGAAIFMQNPDCSHSDAPFDLDAFDKAHRPNIERRSSAEYSEIQAVRPCTPTQCGMIAQSLRSRGGLYINHVSYQKPACVDITGVARAWGAVQRKHQALRLSFHQTQDTAIPFLAVIWSSSACLPPVISLSDGLDLEDVEAKAAKEIISETGRPAWRVHLVPQYEQTVMTLSMHHANYDSEGLQYVLRDFQSALQGGLAGSEIGIDALLLSASDWTSEQSRSGEAYWKTAMQHASTTKFPDLSPVATRRSRMRLVTHTFSAQRSSIVKYCKAHNATMQAVGQAAWALLLSAYTGEASVTFGTVFSNRAGSPSQATAFPCISTIPVPCSTDKDTMDIVAEMVDYNASAHRHRLTPLGDIQRYAGDAQQSLFDTVFVYQKATTVSLESFEWPVVRESAAVDYVASLELEALHNGEVSVSLTVDDSKIPLEQAHLMLLQYDYLLARIIGSPVDVTITRILSTSPAKETELPSEVALLHQFVELSALRIPDNPALDFVYSTTASTTWTYKQLNDRGNQVAHLLKHHGVKPNSIVAVCMRKCPEASFAIVGILKAGCSFLALDPDLPARRQAFILHDSGAAALLTGPTTAADRAETEGLHTPIMKLTEELLHTYPSDPIDAPLPDSSATCYCLYTSGTTGNPKGCEISHDNAVQAMLAFQRLFKDHWTETSRWLQFASYWFDVSVLEQFWSWSVGITVVGAPRDLVLSDIPGFVQQQSITHIDLTPSLARIVLPDEVPSLHGGVFITGGEALKQEIIDSWGSKLTICNGYGPTEATIGVTMNSFIGQDAKPSNIGKQFDNVGTYVLDPDSDQPVLRGVIGELCISGRLVGKGYLNRPDLTAKSFPTLSYDGERVYRTGDLVRLLADDSYSFVGRQDTQVKLRGQRLEIAEIDSTVRASSAMIEDVVSLVVKDDMGARQTLVSFFTLRNAGKIMELKILRGTGTNEVVAAATASCMQKLANYMVPTHIVPLTRIPLTVNNKVDTKGIVALFRSTSVVELQGLIEHSSRAGPLTHTERQVGSILSSMLKIDIGDINRDSSLFALGLSSVSAITFATLLKRCGFGKASVALILQNSTLVRLVSALSETDSGSMQERGYIKQAELSISAFAQCHRTAVARRLSVDVLNIESVTPCTPLQAGLLLDSLRTAESPYFNEFRYRLGDIEVNRLLEAFVRMIPAIEMLRTSFVQTDDGFAHVVLRHSPPYWHDCAKIVGTVEGILAGQREAWLLANEEDIVQPLRVAITNDTHGSLLVIYVHHSLYDGIAWDLLMDKLAESYLSHATPSCGPSYTSVLPHGPLLQRPDAKSFWSQRLPASRYTPLQSASSGTGLKTSPAAAASLLICDTSRIESKRKLLHVSHQALLQACFEVALQQHFYQVGTYGQVLSGRSIAFEGADRVVGPLFNTLPVSINLSPADTWNMHINRCHQQNVAFLPYQHTPLSDIRRWCGRGASEPLFDVLFVTQHQSRQPIAEEHGLWHIAEQAPHADYPLAFETTMRPDKMLDVTVVARRNIADETALQALLRSFEAALEAAIERPDQQIGAQFDVGRHSMQVSSEAKQTSFPQVNGVHDFIWLKDAEMLREAIAHIAGVATGDVDEHSTIFALGLDSIDAVKLASRAKKAGLALPVSQILQAQTIFKMLHVLKQATPASSHVTARRILEGLESHLTAYVKVELLDANEIERVLPATPNQEALIADMLRSDFTDYYNHDILRLREGLDVDRFKAAWQMVVDNAPILRTGFLQVTAPDVDVTFAQVVWQPRPVHFAHASVSSQRDLDDIVHGVTEAVSADQSIRSLLRLTLVTWASEHYVILSLAHAQYDGRSLALLHEDVRRAYSDSLGTRPSYDGLLEDGLSGTNEEARSFWASCLSDAKVHSFPRRETYVSSTVVHRAGRASQLSANVVHSFCKKRGISMQALAQTSWSLLLAHYTRSFEVVSGVVLACRDSEEAEQVMFPAMNTVPVRAALHGSRLEMLQYMQSMINDMRPHQRTPLRAIQAACAETVDIAGRGGLFDTLFVYQHRPEPAGEDAHRLYESVGGASSVEYPVAVEMEAVGDELHMRAVCKDSVLDKHGTSNLLQLLDRVLRSIVLDTEDPTVSFLNTEVSICGLPPFVLEIRENDVNPDLQDVQDEATDDKQEMIPVAASIQEALAQVARLPIDHVSPTATIESIGIDSISAIKVAALLRKQDISLTVSEILRAKTALRMAETATAKGAAADRTHEMPSEEIVSKTLRDRGLTGVLEMNQDNVKTILPATPGQVYMLSMWQASGGQLFYSTFSYEMKGDVDAGKLRRAWQELVARHAILRTVFYDTGNETLPVLQVVLKEVYNSFFEEKLFKGHELQQSMVALYVHQDRGSWQAALKIHHALYDAVSLSLLVQDFKDLLAGTQPSLPSANYHDYVALSITAEAQEARKTFWSSYLSGAKPMRLRQPETRGQQRRVELFRPGFFITTSSLGELARKESVTIQALLFAAYAKIYAGLATTSKESGSATQEADVVLGIYLSNRSHLPNLDKLVAPNLNLVPLLVRSPTQKSLLDVAKQIQSDLGEIGSAQNSAVGLWEIAEWTGVKVDTFVNFIKLPEQSEEERGAEGGVFITALDDRRTTEYSRVVERKKMEDFELPKELRDMEVEDAYQHSLDIEATVTNGALDVGLFCPEEMLGLKESQGVLEELRSLLEKLVGKAKE